jgi:hypothetical protein
MKYAMVSSLLVAAALSWAAPAEAAENPILKAMGNLRWGMDDLALKSAMKGKFKGDSPYVEFNGQTTRWDSSPLAEEYTHGNEEAMFVGNDGSAENYFFFIGGQLWKWVKLYPASAFGGADFKHFSQKLQTKFGKGYEKKGEINPHSGLSYAFVEFMDRNTRLRAVDKTEKYGQFALVFESMDTVRSLSALRSNTIRKGGAKASTAMASARPSRVSDDEDEDSAPVRSSARPSQSAAAPAQATSSGKAKRSIFEGDQQGGSETAAQYEARKRRVLAEQRGQQTRLHQRGEEAKKGKTLDELAGINDDDPLGGMR